MTESSIGATILLMASVATRRESGTKRPLVEPQHVESLRRFNRFYTRQLGLLDKGYLSSNWTLTDWSFAGNSNPTGLSKTAFTRLFSSILPTAEAGIVPVILTVLAFNFLGDGLRDAADPYH